MWVPYLVLCLECFLHSQSLWKQWWQLWSAWPVDVDLLFWTEQGTCSAESELPTLQIGCPWTAFDDHTSGAGMVLECTVIARRHARWLDTREWSLGLYWCRSWFPKTVLELSPRSEILTEPTTLGLTRSGMFTRYCVLCRQGLRASFQATVPELWQLAASSC